MSPVKLAALPDRLDTVENTIAPKLRVEFEPFKAVRMNAAYGGYWLDHNSDGWVQVKRNDPTGRAGTFIGQELECRLLHVGRQVRAQLLRVGIDQVDPVGHG